MALGPPDILSAVHHVLIDWNHEKIPILFLPHVLPSRIYHEQSPVVAAKLHETTGQARIVNAFGTPSNASFAGLYGFSGRGGKKSDYSLQAYSIVYDEESWRLLGVG